MRAFATALEMQQDTEEEAVALKTELELTMHNSEREMNALVEEVNCQLLLALSSSNPFWRVEVVVIWAWRSNHITHISHENILYIITSFCRRS